MIADHRFREMQYISQNALHFTYKLDFGGYRGTNSIRGICGVGGGSKAGEGVLRMWFHFPRLGFFFCILFCETTEKYVVEDNLENSPAHIHIVCERSGTVGAAKRAESEANGTAVLDGADGKRVGGYEGPAQGK